MDFSVLVSSIEIALRDTSEGAGDGGATGDGSELLYLFQLALTLVGEDSHLILTKSQEGALGAIQGKALYKLTTRHRHSLCHLETPAVWQDKPGICFDYGSTQFKETK